MKFTEIKEGLFNGKVSESERIARLADQYVRNVLLNVEVIEEVAANNNIELGSEINELLSSIYMDGKELMAAIKYDGKK